MAKGPHPASPAKGRGEKDGSDFIDPDAVLTVAGNNRRVQRRPARRRRLFGKKAKEAFLESFATTANVAASAEAIGFSEGLYAPAQGPRVPGAVLDGARTGDRQARRASYPA
jgi:hypothetical protein